MIVYILSSKYILTGNYTEEQAKDFYRLSICKFIKKYNLQNFETCPNCRAIIYADETVTGCPYCHYSFVE